MISGHPDYLGPYSIQTGLFSPIVQVSNPTAGNLEILVEVKNYDVSSNLFGARNIPNKNQYFSLIIFSKILQT